MDVMEQKKPNGTSPDFVLTPTSPTQAVGDDVADSGDACVTFEVDDDDDDTSSSVVSRVIPHADDDARQSNDDKNDVSSPPPLREQKEGGGFLEDLRRRLDDLVNSTDDQGGDRAMTYDEAMAVAARVHRERIEREAAESAAVLNVVAESAPSSPHRVISPRLITAHANVRASSSLMDNDPCYVQVSEL